METIEYKGYTIEIDFDQNAEDPRTIQDCLTRMICFHKRYSIGDKHDYKNSDYSGWDEIEAQLYKDHDILIIKPLYLYDHSGLTISTSPFSCPWDSGQIGFVFVTKDAARSNWGCKRISKKIKAHAERLLDAEVKEYDDFISGQIYFYVIKDENDEVLDSCGGWYGSDSAKEDSEMMKQAKSMIDSTVDRNYPVTDGNDEERVCSICKRTFRCHVLQNRPTLPGFEIKPELCRVCNENNKVPVEVELA